MAEVLVTLAVIGVVASLTIPALVKNQQEAGWKSSFKKIYSELEQASRLIKQDRGNLDFTNHDDARNNFKLYFTNLNPGTEYEANCWLGGTKGLNGDIVSASATNCYILKSGVYIQIQYDRILVDVNGEKQPNTYGKDIYRIAISPDAIKPYGADGVGSYSYLRQCDGSLTGLSGHGYGCAAKVLKNEDY